MKKSTIGMGLLGLGASAVLGRKQLRKPEKLSDEKTRWLTEKIIAHRGIHNNGGNAPENTLAAFQKAVEKNYPIELDVRLTRDKKVVVIHDKKLKRLLGYDEEVQDLNFSDFKDKTILGSDQRVPLFREVLELVDGKVPILVEIKSHGAIGPLEKRLYDLLKHYKGAYAIQSFNPFSVKWFHDHAGEVVRGQLSGNFQINEYEKAYQGAEELPVYQKFLLKNLMFNFLSRPNFIAYEIQDTEHARLIKIQKLGVPLLGWTVKNRIEYLEVKDLCDNLIVDDVTLVF
ncbi:glycerophosphodiester phosphodiesterase [Alkalibacter rhizosphaerae]|uniref:Glycerophosphodiester phosphodiesterase n=1 Tax=Alkalibacter rhizosphaerae TaxID=2815577 RepID=A0A974XNK8_9FIRM|nr:glycerophosphodiester phosphodiesterase family protein [Alkalibacter rhizosphaerae]QSX09151.1 glycerophosphodiester phosphodiesterase [Alkalibacter rhizosphaerae]